MFKLNREPRSNRKPTAKKVCKNKQEQQQENRLLLNDSKSKNIKFDKFFYKNQHNGHITAHKNILINQLCVERCVKEMRV